MVGIRNKIFKTFLYAISLAILIQIVTNLNKPNIVSNNSFLISQVLLILVLVLYLYFNFRRFSIKQTFISLFLIIIMAEVFNMIAIFIGSIYLYDNSIGATLYVISDMFVIRILAGIIYSTVLIFISFTIKKLKG